MEKVTFRACFVAALVIVTATLLYMTQIDREARFFYHLDLVFFELFFIPVVLGCLWMGTTGGLWTAFGVAVLLLPYLVLHWEGLSAADLNRILRILIFFLASVILGKAIHRQREEQKRATETERLAAIGKSMAIVAHDLKTPLIAIGGFSAFVLRKLDPDFPHRDKLEIVVEEARRLEGMLKDMLAYSKPLELNRAPEDIGELVTGTLALTRAKATERGVKLHGIVSDRLQSVVLDGMKMKQVLVNLVSNAIEASPKGEAVTVKAHVKRKALIIDVMDCGCGIPADRRRDVFLPFFTTKKEGTGLGLDVTKKIVESHGGTIEIIDNVRKGVVFKVTIPLVSETEAKGA